MIELKIEEDDLYFIRMLLAIFRDEYEGTSSWKECQKEYNSLKNIVKAKIKTIEYEANNN